MHLKACRAVEEMRAVPREALGVLLNYMREDHP
jgi:hypothetical protein